ncbi:uncharacterized protein LOC125760315 [Rhipicephalus sanguineus]|uniref:uncharacterized protein LOC125760315 n=1 Tax=Rhipicephalus sanguineus TaxID=34632 RepID=UPI0020C40B42|nr:uncharacterized protein LOC125760315 [Rhipicephalus sanguineus]
MKGLVDHITHKPECPLRVIVSEKNTWQKHIAMFLQDKLNLLVGEDPFRVKNSMEVVEFFANHEGMDLDALSVDVKDLYYSIPQDALLRCIEASIDRYGAIGFQNRVGIPVASFLELVTFYLCSTYVRWEGSVYLQRSGICIGSSLAPVLSELFLGQIDERLNNKFAHSNNSGKSNRNKKVAVIPYIHRISHNLKEAAQKAGVEVAFSAPQKLSRLCRLTEPCSSAPLIYDVKHRVKFVQCQKGVVYNIPLSCGKVYIGQTGRCLNERLREHSNNRIWCDAKNQQDRCTEEARRVALICHRD